MVRAFDKELWTRMLSVLEEDELSSIQQIIWEIQNEEARRKVKNEDYPMLDREEMGLLRQGRTILAIKAYKDRTSVSLRLAKFVIDHEKVELGL